MSANDRKQLNLWYSDLAKRLSQPRANTTSPTVVNLLTTLKTIGAVLDTQGVRP